jgi:serine/threonine-protein kinase
LQLVKLDVPTLARLSPLMDEALELDDEQLAAWLSNLSADNADLIPTLRELLSKKASVQTRDILQRGPEFAAPGTAINPSDFKAGDAVGTYRLIRELGRGGMGEVWLAERIDGSLRRQVALKLPHIALPQRQLVERFARERDILASLVHVNIARLYDAGVSDKGQPYLALEYVQGEMLTTWCDAKKLGIKARIELFLQVLAAVAYAHSQLVVHRDLKPSNILVTADAQVRLLDFGIAKLMTDGQAHETELTQLGGRALSLQYASPEQILGQPIATSSDVYSLGVVLHELLTGALPYRVARNTHSALEEAILSGAPQRPARSELSTAVADARGDSARKLRRILAGDLETILLKAIKRKPEDRYISAEALAADLQRFLNGLPVLARPDSRRYRVYKFVDRNRLAVAAATIVTIALGAGLGLALWQASVARQQTAIAVEEAQTARAVHDFLADIFMANSVNQPDPKKARETTARELLDIGATKIDSSLSNAPEAKVAVLRLVSDMYLELGLNERAALLGDERVALLRKLRGPDHLDVAEQLVNQSRTIQQTNRSPERELLLQEALRIFEHHSDSDPKLYLGVLRQLALLEHEKRSPKALDYAQRAVAAAEGIKPNDELISGLLVLGRVQNYADRSEAALNTLMRATDLVAANPGYHRRQRIQLIAYLGDAQAALGMSQEAETNFREGFERASQLSGPDHLDTAQMEYRLARLLFDTGRTREGLQLLESARDRCVRARGANNASFLPDVLLAEAQMRATVGDLDGSLQLVERGLQLLVNDKHRVMATHLLLQQAHIFLDMGRVADASAALEHVTLVERERGIIVTEEREIHNLLSTRLLLAQRQPDRARATWEQSRSGIGTEPQSFAAWARFIEWGELALALGEPQTGLQAAEHAIKKIANGTAPKYLELRELRALRLAGLASLALGSPQAAMPRLRRAVTLAERLFDGKRSIDLADIQIALAQCLLDLKQPREARTLASKARAIHTTHKELGDQYRRPLRALEARLAGMPKR